MLYDKLERVQRNLVDGLEGVNAQLIAIAADGAAAEASNPVSPMNFNSLIAVSNQHTANSTAINGALESVLARIRVLEQDVGLPATVGALANAVQVLMARVDRISGPTSADPIAGNVNGKRARDDDVNDEGPAKRQHFAPTIAAPPMLAFPPAAPAYVPPTHHGAPAYIPPTPQAPSAYVPPAHHSAAYAARAPASVAAALPRAPGTAALPRAPAAGPPRARIDPAREVLFGPIDWEKNWNHSPRVLISSVPNLNMKGARYTSRRGPDDTFVILVFEADTVADWFVKAWNENPRIAYELCFASKNV
ncbi:hypothetical protein B0H10DRAFT_2013990 [Mycena sp. CBHHK59/15]|nr:hypothetical protein B0H10DRAFT_2070784 [Mycena sp. CBHHK59/15]KAJ6622466.1 hypothetical protein B0H10DRAFT_2013990 [Mycena sp. CBHHK59/15]